MDCLKNISGNDVVATIQNARQRLVFLAPGIDTHTAKELGAAWLTLGPEAVTVILDLDPEVVRLGYGTLEGLEEIQQMAASIGQAVCHQPGVRICVLIADETSLIFTPTPLLIEAGSTQPERPNGIQLHATPKTLGDELGLGVEGPAAREIGLEVARPALIEAVKRDLKENPALKFDISRKERVFNAKLEFVEFELEGCFISRHTVTIPAELVGMAKMDPKTREKLRSSFRLIESSELIDSTTKISERSLREERKRITQIYLRTITGFGTVIRRSNREAFEKEVDGLRMKVEDFCTALRRELKTIYENNARRLTAALLPSVAENPPEQWTGALGLVPTSEEIEKYFHQTLLRSFGDPEALLREMRVNLTFKGITYGTLSDPKFIETASREFPNLKLHDEYDAARGSSASTAADAELLLS